jgi:hypothetical protein
MFVLRQAVGGWQAKARVEPGGRIGFPTASAVPRMLAHGTKDSGSAGDHRADLILAAKTGHTSKGNLL